MQHINQRKKMWRVGVVVPAEWKPLIHRRMSMKGYISIGDYLRDLIREDLLEAGLLGGENSEHED